MADDEDEDTTKDEATAEDEDSSSDEAEDSSGEEGSDEEEAEDDPSFGKKEDEPVNDVQMKYLNKLAEAQDEEIPEDMSEKEATDKIDELQEDAAG
jgi:hypothetical protein